MKKIQFGSPGVALLPVAVLAIVLALSTPASLPAQSAGILPKNSPQFLDAFRAAAAQASKATVRVRCEGKDIALGTVVGSDGWILTKASDLSAKPVVRLKDGRELEARVVGVHQAHDIALLKVAAADLTPVAWRPSKEVAVGSWAISAGPDGRPVTVGVVSVGTRTLPAGKEWVRNPAGGFLGITLDPSEKEAKISQLVPGSGAVKAGLKVNDTILSIAGKTIPDPEEVLKVLGSFKPGQEVEVRVKRGDKEIEVKAKLGKRPLDRGEFQNSMGSELSKRRSGFSTILQHDSVVRPSDCGGPLVDLDGKVIGINICRAGRTESYAIPSEILLPLLPEMQAGRHPPRPAESETAAK
jgi:serine protease Do